jgi:hypothetical protein
MEELLARVVLFEARLKAGDPRLSTPTGNVLDKVKHDGHLGWTVTAPPVLLKAFANRKDGSILVQGSCSLLTLSSAFLLSVDGWRFHL